MTDLDRVRWNAKYAVKTFPHVIAPDEWLVNQLATWRTPPSSPTIVSNAMELACGLGHNSIWLAQNGWNVDAIDISPVGLALAKQAAEQQGSPPIHWIAADLDSYEPCLNRYDLIVVFRFLDRQRLPSVIESALRPGGLLIYETFSRNQMARPDNHLKNAEFTLAPGELPTLFPNLTTLASEEIDLPDRSVSRLTARKP